MNKMTPLKELKNILSMGGLFLRAQGMRLIPYGVLLMACNWGGVYLEEVIGKQQGENPLSWYFLLGLCTLWVQLSFLVFHKGIKNGEGFLPVGVTLKKATRFLPRYFLYTLAYYLIGGGLLILIIPGLYFLIVHQFVPLYALYPQQTNDNFFTEGRKLIRGHFFTAVGFSLLIIPFIVGEIGTNLIAHEEIRWPVKLLTGVVMASLQLFVVTSLVEWFLLLREEKKGEFSSP